jgi:hypothetical protein
VGAVVCAMLRFRCGDQVWGATRELVGARNIDGEGTYCYGALASWEMMAGCSR